MTESVERRQTARTVRVGADGAYADTRHDRQVYWEDRTRIVLSPIAAPSVLGLFGFFGATLMVGSNMAGWWGNDVTTAAYIAPFALIFGGLAQLLAGMWSYKARDALATAVHGTWGSFWLAFGMYYLMVAGGAIPGVTSMKFPAFGFWFIVLCVITFMAAIASLARNLGTFAVLAPLCVGSGFAAAAHIAGNTTSLRVAGWLFVFAAGFAFYTASAMMLENSFGRVILPVAKWRIRANVPGAHDIYPIQYEEGMPGARVGQ